MRWGASGRVLAGGLIWAFGWNWCDPAISALIGLLVIYSAWRLVAESVAVLMEGAPKGIDVDEVRQAMLETPGVASMHDLHVWTITSALDSLSAHVVADDGEPPAELLSRLRCALRQRFGISHATIQIEPPDHAEDSRAGMPVLRLSELQSENRPIRVGIEYCDRMVAAVPEVASDSTFRRFSWKIALDYMAK